MPIESDRASATSDVEPKWILNSTLKNCFNFSLLYYFMLHECFWRKCLFSRDSRESNLTYNENDWLSCFVHFYVVYITCHIKG